ncbi:MAG: hypothetical protein ACI33S_02290 [Bacilli bacterium]
MKNVDEKNNKTSNSTKKTNHKNTQNKVKDVEVVKPEKIVQDEGVRVKEIKVTTIDDDFLEEDEDKKLIVVIAIAILIIMATIVGLLVGCEKKELEEPEKPNDDVVLPIEDNTTDEEETKETVKKVTVKTEDKEEPTTTINYYSVKFMLMDGTFKYLEVEENSLISKFVPTGYNYCTYYSDKELTSEFNFKNRINEDTIIYTVCTADNYTIEYNVDTTNPTLYNSSLGTIVLDEAISLEQLPFLGWYLDSEFTSEEVSELSTKLLEYADENKVIKLYAKFGALNISYYNQDEEIILTEEYYGSYTINEEIRGVCSESNFLGWSTNKDSKVISYKGGESVNKLREDLNLYPVCGSATVIYTSEGNSVSVGYTTEELIEYNLPQPSDLEIDTPTYVIPVDEVTENSKKVVPDEAIEILENEIRLQDAKDKAGSNYIPEVGDYVEEHNKVFVGWVEKEETLEGIIDDNVIEDGVVTEEPIIPDIEVLPDDYVPEDNKTTELEAIWREQTEEELLSGEYDSEEIETEESNSENQDSIDSIPEL